MARSTGKYLSLPMHKLRNALTPKWILTLALTSLFLVTPVAAQDAVPDAKGELKDFRLDSPPPKDTPAEPAPKVEAPVVQADPLVAAPSPGPVAQPKAQKRVVDTTPTPSTAQPNEPTPDTASSPPVFSDLPPPAEESDSFPTEDTASAQTPATANYSQYWPLLAALLVALAGLALFSMWKRRHANVVVEATAAPVMRKPISPAAPRVSKPQILQSGFTAKFEPDNARLSVANLTITGRLHLHYDGDAPLETLRLRTLVMSACDGQKDKINNFHTDPEAGQVNSLGPVAPGEEIRMKLEMQVPREALQAFDWRERRFVAPIVLINVASDDPAIQPYQVTCVVGQTGVANSARLQPLPIDRGPKLFDALQFRPIAA
ncbi:MAG: hypothetical protein ABL928_14085 [Sphingorhabdus sp.]